MHQCNKCEAWVHGDEINENGVCITCQGKFVMTGIKRDEFSFQCFFLDTIKADRKSGRVCLTDVSKKGHETSEGIDLDTWDAETDDILNRADIPAIIAGLEDADYDIEMISSFLLAANIAQYAFIMTFIDHPLEILE